MFKRKVALVVGAGASFELGFPLGSQLKDQLRRALDIKFRNFNEQYSGDYEVVEALRALVRNRGGSQDINPYLHGGRAIAEAMPTTASIDSFLQTHHSNEQIVTMGKLGIARCILEAERKSRLFREDANSAVDLGSTEKTWYAEFFKLLAGEVEEPKDIFKNLAIVSFNYDRSLEHYLWLAIAKRFLVSPQRAQEIVASLTMHHPYGVAGYLPWQKQNDNIPYGGTDHFGDLLTVAAGLRTFSEGVEEGYVERIRSALAESEVILLIGFGFGAINMDLLNIPGAKTDKRVFATAFDIHVSEIMALQHKLAETLNAKPDSCRAYSECTGAKLFEMCRISFSEL